MTKKSLNITNWAISLLAVAFGITLLIAGFVSFSVVRDLTASYTGVGLNPFQNSSGDEVDGPAAPDVTPTAVRLEATPQPWDGKSRVTVLVMGLDYRDWVSSKDAPRSDTMMLITIDPITLQAGMLSIPRDLWVEIPGFTYNRINTAFMFGEAYNLPGGGPALAQKTVENLLGVPITYYAVIDFHAFERIIDEIGGIEVLVEQRVKISPIGGISKWLEAKPYHLDGADALAFIVLHVADPGHAIGPLGDHQITNLLQQSRFVLADKHPMLTLGHGLKEMGKVLLRFQSLLGVQQVPRVQQPVQAGLQFEFVQGGEDQIVNPPLPQSAPGLLHFSPRGHQQHGRLTHIELQPRPVGQADLAETLLQQLVVLTQASPQFGFPAGILNQQQYPSQTQFFC